MTGTEAPLSQSFVELGPLAFFWGQILSFNWQKISDWGGGDFRQFELSVCSHKYRRLIEDFYLIFGLKPDFDKSS